MGFNIDPKIAREVYEHAKKDLAELETKKRQLVEIYGRCPVDIDRVINQRKEEARACAYYAGIDPSKDF